MPAGTPRPTGPAPRRPVISDFAPRPHAPIPRPPQPGVLPTHPPVPAPVRPTLPLQPIQEPQSAASLPPADTAADPTPEEPAETPAIPEDEPKQRHPTAHSGLVGFLVFIVLAALALSPLLSGKIVQDFPGSSQSFSTGDQTIGCAGALGQITSTSTYNTKRGFPLVYTYSTTSTLQASCGGRPKTATGGHTSQFNPLGGVIDIAAAGVIAIIVAATWRRLFGIKD